MKKNLTHYFMVVTAALCLGIALPTVNTPSSFLTISNGVRIQSVENADLASFDGENGGNDKSTDKGGGSNGPDGPHNH